MARQTTRPRRKRTWAPRAEGVTALSRSGRQLAKNSATKLAVPSVAQCLEKYRYVLAVERACKLLRGDLLVTLIDRHGLRAIDIARQTNETPSDISQMYTVSRTFPVGSRPLNVPYNHLLLATRMTRKFPRLQLRPAEALKEILRTGMTQHRDVTRHFSQLERTHAAHRHRQLTDQRHPTGTNTRPFIRAHLMEYQALLPEFADRSIQILAIDPPYIYGDTPYRARSARSRACDNDDSESAVALICDLLRDWQPKLTKGGVVLLWQPWQSLLPAIVRWVERYDWAIEGPIIWDKGRPQPGDFATPYSIQGEFLWLLHRPGDKPKNYDGSSRHTILRFPPASFPGTSARQSHCFEKPAALCEFLIKKHSREGDLVFDACGCTGSMSVAAIRLKRQWVYAESNAENFKVGRERIAEAQEY